MAMIKGIPVVLLQKIKIDEDPFGQAIYREREIIVENILVSPSSANDIITSQNLTGKKATIKLHWIVSNIISSEILAEGDDIIITDENKSIMCSFKVPEKTDLILSVTIMG